MAEYIDRGRLKQCFHANICGGNAYDELIDMQPTADVIERSKIDKAIEEIEKSFEPIVGTYNGDTPERQLPSRKIERNEGRYQALEILKRNIGE